MKKMGKKIFILCFIVFSFQTLIAEGDKNKRSNELAKIFGEPSYTHFNINNISTWIYNNGWSDISFYGDSGFEYPKGTGKTAMFQSGFLWGGKVNGEVRTGGSAYRTGLAPGKILNNEVGWNQLQAEDPDASHARIYRVRPDYKTAVLISEINDGEGTETEIKKQYERDWNDWPAESGAPYEDVDRDGVYNPEVDIPGFPGADQTIWFVANDADSNMTQQLYGSLPMGIELQVTIWGYNVVLSNMIFKKYKLINKSDTEFTEMYLSMWSDPDVGDASDDFVGCDTVLQMGYAYNAEPEDAIYGSNPPSTGFTFLQGPIIESEPEDTARYDGRLIPGKRNLPMTSSYFFIGPHPLYRDPTQGQYIGTLELYTILQGKIGNGENYQIPLPAGGGVTVFPLSGDPVNRTGWYDGILDAPDDRRVGISSGPFNMAPGDTQEVIFAEIAAGGYPPVSHLDAIILLKQYAQIAKYSYYSSFFGIPDKVVSVTGTGLDRKIILSWGNDEKSVNKIEGLDVGGFKFQGYNIYQLPSPEAEIKDGIKIATFDRIDGIKTIVGDVFDPVTGIIIQEVQQVGTDSGIERFLIIEKDHIKGKVLNNGSKYYFAVTAYTYNSFELLPKNTESRPAIITIIPQGLNPGIRYNAEPNDKIDAVHLTGTGDGNVTVTIVEPALLTGDTYLVSFDLKDSLTWSLTNTVNNRILLQNQTNFSGDGEYFIKDGFQVKVIDGNKTLTSEDSFIFNVPGIINEFELAKEDINKINVFPNPYYAINSQEASRHETFVTFNHLPQKAVIRIFDLSGQLVRTIYKDSHTQFEIWNLLNEHNIPVASGIFLIYIEMPELDKIKVLKLAVVQRQLIPDYY